MRVDRVTAEDLSTEQWTTRTYCRDEAPSVGLLWRKIGLPWAQSVLRSVGETSMHEKKENKADVDTDADVKALLLGAD